MTSFQEPHVIVCAKLINLPISGERFLIYPINYVWFSPKTGRPFNDVKKAFVSACVDVGTEGLLWFEFWLRRMQAYDIAKLSHAHINESAKRSQFPAWRRRGSHAKKSAPAQQHRSHALSGDSGTLMVVLNS